MPHRRPPSVLGLHLSSRGFGWALFDTPTSLFDWGIVEIRGDSKNADALVRVARILTKYRPGQLAIETFQGEGTRRSKRVRALYRQIVRQSETMSIEVCVVTRPDIRGTFGSPRSREDVAATVAERFPALRPRLPKRRRIWVGEHPSMALFSAAACALTVLARSNT